MSSSIESGTAEAEPSKFRAVEEYMSRACWEVLKSSRDDSAKMQLLAKELACLGISMEREKTTFCEAAMVALHTTHTADMPRTRATEICGALCPECCMIEARPGCCIEPRGHENEHYCGKCGYSDTSD